MIHLLYLCDRTDLIQLYQKWLDFTKKRASSLESGESLSKRLRKAFWRAGKHVSELIMMKNCTFVESGLYLCSNSQISIQLFRSPLHQFPNQYSAPSRRKP